MNKPLKKAIKLGASYIHLEIYKKFARMMRHRFDGVLMDQSSKNKKLFDHYAAIVARIKIMSKLDIAERRLPQDGVIALKVEDREVDFRASILPISSKILFAFVGVILSITITGVASEGANPFNPIFSSGTSSVSPELIEGGTHPLQQNPVNSYILMGVITSSKGKIGLIRARNGGEYFVRLEELLGNENGKITQINQNGIEISEKDKIVSLLVRNRSVSNEKTE